MIWIVYLEHCIIWVVHLEQRDVVTLVCRRVEYVDDGRQFADDVEQTVKFCYSANNTYTDQTDEGQSRPRIIYETKYALFTHYFSSYSGLLVLDF